MRSLLSVLVLCLLASSAPALDAGDKAPSLPPLKWFVSDGLNPGEPDGKHTYVVVFWASTSENCRAIIGLLNQLHTSYGNRHAKIMAITQEKPDTLALFLANAPFRHSVAMDATGAASKLYMKGIPGIPHAFVIDKTGVVRWHGHPVPRLPSVLAKVMAGTFNPEEEKKIVALENQVHAAASQRNLDEVLKLLDQLIALEATNPRYYGLKARLLTITNRKQEVPAVFAAWAKGCGHSAEGLGALADTLLKQEDLSLRDPALALQYAKQAMTISQGKDLRAYLTLSEAYGKIGLFTQALAVLAKAKTVAPKQDIEDIDNLIAYYTKLQAAQAGAAKDGGE